MELTQQGEALVSVIVPIYNAEKHIRKCVDSLVNQTYQNTEIILVDDGSPDTSGKICDEYAGKYDRVKVIHKSNGGERRKEYRYERGLRPVYTFLRCG